MADRRDAQLRKWYFCVNARGFEDVWPLIRVAVRSCLANTDLVPVCLHDSTDAAQAQRLRDLGVRVISHRSRLEQVLRAGYGDLYDTFCGHWLRLDIPWIEAEEEVILYTDVDVMFRAQPRQLRSPRYLAAAPERHRWHWLHFNSGVMVMNLPGLRRIDAAFVRSVERRMAGGWHPPGHDQVSYNRFFKWRRDRLPLALNWKPYWGWRSDAEIVHFHGPKPVHVARLKSGASAGMLPDYGMLWQLNPQAYDRYGTEFERFSD